MMILDKIFSIKEYNKTTNVITILGIRIKTLKKYYAKALKQHPFDEYRKKNVDITTIPPATGQLRAIQLANLALLEELDYVCKQSGLKYWLDGGTLLGAVRHKGFIPWDDDIDTAMLREDYEKIIPAFQKFSRNPDIYAEYYRKNSSSLVCFIKVMHKKCPYLFVDIFPWDTYGKKLSVEEQIQESQRIKDTIKMYEKNKSDLSIEEIRKINEKIMKDDVLQPNSDETSDYVWGVDFHHTWKNWFTRYDVLHPLKQIEFEGRVFPCMNNPDAFLKRLYGNYMAYPKKIGVGHNAYAKIPEKQMEIIKSLGK